MKYAIGRQRKEDGKPCVTKRNNRESSFNMTRGGDEDIETRSLKF